MTWNYGDILDEMSQVVPATRPALRHGDRVITWEDYNKRTNNFARALQDRGVKAGDKVAFYMRNCPEYMETVATCFRGRFVHVNVNYRYRAHELFYIFDNSDAKVVVYSSEFRANIEALRPTLNKVAVFVEVSSGEVAPFAERYEDLATTGTGENLDIRRSGEDMLFIYTGGTTGMPKGVMWQQQDLYAALNNALRALGPVPENLPELVKFVEARPEDQTPSHLPACPQMHGTGLLTCFSALAGGTITTLPSLSLDSDELWQAVQDSKTTSIAIVGDAFAKPMLASLNANAGRWDLSSLFVILSSGVMWSTQIKKGLLKHLPHAIMADSFAASEGLGFGTSMMTVDGESRTGRFAIGERCKVFTANNEEVKPGSGTRGYIAVSGSIPQGYYKDPKKTAEVFKTINNVRYSVPGDWCTVDADGTLTLLGRGSNCINTAGEKVYPEEVEEVLKTYPDVYDALVVGVPDPKWGMAVTAVIQPVTGLGAGDFNTAKLSAYASEQLAGYKAPKHVLLAQVPLRAPNGKADYKSAQNFAKEQLGLVETAVES